MDWLRQTLLDLEKRGLLRDPPLVGPDDTEAADGRTVLVEGRRYVSFASNNYLGLAGDERVRRAASDAALKYGAGAGASRLVVGTHSLHRELEDNLARFKGTEDCVLFTTGYQAGVGAVTVLAGRGDSVILDKLSHACLVDGARASKARVRVFPHLDLGRLEELLKREADSRRRLIVTDSLFSMDGDVAPLAEILALADEHDAMLLVDEAHATGTLGPGGRGLVAELGLTSPRLVQMGTLSKALGSVGGFIAGTRDLASYLRNTARSYVYTTAPAPAAMGAALEALRIINENSESNRSEEPILVEALRANVKRLAESCPGLGARTPIVPVLVGEAPHAVEMQAAMRERGMWVPAIRPPTVPRGESRLRISLTAAHSHEDVDRLGEALADLGLDACSLDAARPGKPGDGP